MARTDPQRFDEALACIWQIKWAFGDEMNQKFGSKVGAGGEITLAGEGYWHGGSDEQHTAVRACLLCLIAYFRPPHATRDDATFAIGQERTRMKGKTVIQVKEEILNFLPNANAHLQHLVDTANRINNTKGGLAFYGAIRTCHDDTLGPNPICYDGV